MQGKILMWLGTGQIGASSKNMAMCILDMPHDGSYPHDPDDFNRCLLFLKAVPEARTHLHKLKSCGAVWTALVERWNDIERSFLDEVGLNWCKARRATDTYDLMQSIIINVPVGKCSGCGEDIFVRDSRCTDNSGVRHYGCV